MSKSKGDTLSVSVLKEKGYDPLAYRFMCLNSHYRKQLVFSYEVLESSENEYKKLIKRISNLNKEGSINNDLFDKYNNEFKETLKNDLNTASSLTLLYKLATTIDYAFIIITILVLNVFISFKFPGKSKIQQIEEELDDEDEDDEYEEDEDEDEDDEEEDEDGRIYEHITRS